MNPRAKKLKALLRGRAAVVILVTVSIRPDGKVALDWKPPAGPYITLTVEQLEALKKELKRRDIISAH